MIAKSSSIIKQWFNQLAGGVRWRRVGRMTEEAQSFKLTKRPPCTLTWISLRISTNNESIKLFIIIHFIYYYASTCLKKKLGEERYERTKMNRVMIKMPTSWLRILHIYNIWNPLIRIWMSLDFEPNRYYLMKINRNSQIHGSFVY